MFFCLFLPPSLLFTKCCFPFSGYFSQNKLEAADKNMTCLKATSLRSFEVLTCNHALHVWPVSRFFLIASIFKKIFLQLYRFSYSQIWSYVSNTSFCVIKWLLLPQRSFFSCIVSWFVNSKEIFFNHHHQHPPALITGHKISYPQNCILCVDKISIHIWS